MRRLAMHASMYLMLAVSAASPLWAQHAHTETAGPATSGERLGVLVFPNSGAAAAQPDFIRGVKLLHSFEFSDAAAAFRAAEAKDAGFALAYWGEAMTWTHGLWNEQNLDSARAVLQRLGPTPAVRRTRAKTPREQAWLATAEILYGPGEKAQRDTLFSLALEQLVASDPADNEAQTFYALSLMSLSQSVRNVPTYMRAGAIAEMVLRRNPEHPGAAHYVIHAFDDPTHAPLGLYAAQRYAQIAPSADHAQHMTTHIFLALGMWPQVVSQNAVASGPDSSKWRPSHYTSWMHYGLLQEGVFDQANRLLLLTRGNMTSPERPSWRYHLILMRAQQVVDAERWDDASLAWTIDTSGLGASPSAMSVFTEGFAALKRGDHVTAGHASEVLGLLAAEPDTNSRYRLATAIALRQELLGLLQIDAGQKETGLATLRDATRFEDGLAAEYGPPDIVKPTHELLGEVLLGMDQPRDAQQEFTRALALAPGRSLSLRGLALAARADGDTAVALRAELALKENSPAHHP